MEDKGWWFPAKRYGWGWGLPIRWQGWVVMLAFVGLVAAGAVVLKPQLNPIPFLAYVCLLSVIMVLVCWAKGEPPRWRWGKD
jgi:peptidoglycan/LPS O-acetylase OafA/YrhL